MFDLFSRVGVAFVFVVWGLSELLYYPLTRDKFRVTAALVVFLISLLFMVFAFAGFYDVATAAIVQYFVRLGLILLGSVFCARRLFQLLFLIRMQNEFINRIFSGGYSIDTFGVSGQEYLGRLREAGWNPGDGRNGDRDGGVTKDSR